MELERDILDRLKKIETLQEADEERNRAEHQQIMASMDTIKRLLDQYNAAHNELRERVTEVETAFTAYTEAEQKEKQSFMWRTGLLLTIAIFLGDLLSKFISL